MVPAADSADTVTAGAPESQAAASVDSTSRLFWTDTAVAAPSTATAGRQPRWMVLPVTFRPCAPVAAMPDEASRFPASVTFFAPAATVMAVVETVGPGETCVRVTATALEAPSMAMPMLLLLPAQMWLESRVIRLEPLTATVPDAVYASR